MPVKEKTSQTIRGPVSHPATEHIYRAWDEALSKNDITAVLELYAPDAVLESPLVPHLLGTTSGVCRGHVELRRLFEILAQRKPKVRQFYRNPYFTDGRILMWEYPRESAGEEQMDFVEVMEIENGLIHRHRVYWGWFGVNVLMNNEYRR